MDNLIIGAVLFISVFLGTLVGINIASYIQSESVIEYYMKCTNLGGTVINVYPNDELYVCAKLETTIEVK